MGSPDGIWLGLAEAAQKAGCSEGWLRLLIGQNPEWEAEGWVWRAGQRAWVVHRHVVREIKTGLTTRAIGKRK